MTRYSSTAHLYVIEGLGRPKRPRRVAKRWYPLYMYRDSLRARAIFKILVDLDDLPRELAEMNIEDFRIVPPNPAASFDVLRKEAARRRRKGLPPPGDGYPRMRTERPLRRSGPLWPDAPGLRKVGAR